MAMINEVVADHFRARGDANSIVMDLDTGLLSVGLCVRMMRDMVLHGSPVTGSSECDPEEVAALANGVLAHLGQLGALIDMLDKQTRGASGERQ